MKSLERQFALLVGIIGLLFCGCFESAIQLALKNESKSPISKATVSFQDSEVKFEEEFHNVYPGADKAIAGMSNILGKFYIPKQVKILLQRKDGSVKEFTHFVEQEVRNSVSRNNGELILIYKDDQISSSGN